MTEPLFRTDAYLQGCEANVIALTAEGGVVLDRTVFYPQGGGQPGDTGCLRRPDGSKIAIANTLYGPDRTAIVHVPEGGEPKLETGEPVTAELDWNRRYARMRVHTALHLLSVVLAHPVTGGSIGDGEGRLDFDIQDAGLDKGDITARLQKLVERSANVTESWITDEELDANPGLVKTMSVKPPRGSGRVRLVRIEDIDLQPCGGTHVRNTAEIGAVTVTDIEKKGKQNRRVRIKLV